jgi:hypothetical protein
MYRFYKNQMDDFVLSNLNESRNEWCSRLVSILSPRIIEGIRSIFNESWKVSIENKELDKYLMTFQNFLCRVPKWNSNIIDEERQRIIEKSGCNYLEDLITCVHIIQLKVLTCVRVGTRQKKIDISIPKLNDFLHKVYINVASKVYKNAYLFDKNASPLVQQKHNREFEVITEECILKTIRDSIPTEAIVRAYLDESVEQEEEEIIVEDVEIKHNNSEVKKDDKEKEEEEVPVIPEPVKPPEVVPAISNIDDKPIVNRLTFDDMDHVLTDDGREEKISAPKTIERLEEISMTRNIQRKLDEADDDDDDDKLKISEDVSIDLGFTDLNPFEKNTDSDIITLDDIEEL